MKLKKRTEIYGNLAYWQKRKREVDAIVRTLEENPDMSYSCLTVTLRDEENEYGACEPFVCDVDP